MGKCSSFFIAVILQRRSFVNCLSMQYKRQMLYFTFWLCCSDLPLSFPGMSITILKLWTQKNSMYSAPFGRSQVSDIARTVCICAHTYKLITIRNNNWSDLYPSSCHMPCIACIYIIYIGIYRLTCVSVCVFAQVYLTPSP